MDDDEDSVEDAIKRKEARAAKRRRTRAISEGKSIEEFEADELENGHTLYDDLVLDDIDEDDEDEEDFESRRKRSRRSTTPSNLAEDFEEEEEDDAMEQQENLLLSAGLKILNELNELVAEDGHKTVEIFEKLPSRKLYPDYYKLIKKPVSLNQVTKNLKSNKYYDIEEMKQDLLTMCTNAKTYNEEGSWVYADAEAIEKVVSGL